MARRVHGDFLVVRRPDGGAVFTIKSATGEAFEIERSAAQVAETISALSVNPSPPQEPAAESADPETIVAPKKRGKAGKTEENSDA